MVTIKIPIDSIFESLDQLRLLPEKGWSKTYTFEIEFDERGILDVSLWFDFIIEDLRKIFNLPSDAIILPVEVREQKTLETSKQVREIVRDTSNPEPFTKEALELIGNLKDIIKKLAKEMNVHPIAVAGAIADEYSTYDSFDKEVQDTFLAGLPDWIFIVSKYGSKVFKTRPELSGLIELIGRYDERTKNKVKNIIDKISDLTSHDFGKGNIRLETAMNLQLKYPEHFPQEMSHGEMARYLTTDKGMVQVATVFMMDAKAKADFLEPFSDDDKARVAFLITIYKQGFDNFKKLVDDAKSTGDPYEPGEGKIIIRKWEKFVKILELGTD